MKDLSTSFVRTVTPFIVGAVAAWFARHNITFDTEFLSNLAFVLDVLIGSLYYVAVRFLESKFPWVGWLLASPKKPVYLGPVPTNQP